MAIAKALETDQTRQILGLGNNYIGLGVVRAVAKTLETKKILKKLRLNDNEIGPEGFISLAKALETNTTLQDLDLSRGEIGSEAASVIAEALHINKILCQLYLGGRGISDVVLRQIQTPTEENRKLRRKEEIKTESYMAVVGSIDMLNLYTQYRYWV